MIDNSGQKPLKADKRKVSIATIPVTYNAQ